MSGFIEKLNLEHNEEDADVAYGILEKIEDRAAAVVSPTRVIFASITAFIIVSATLFVLIWVIPYDRVKLEVVYMQGGPGHVVLAELENDGSREISSVYLSMRFIDKDGNEQGRSDFSSNTIPAHSTIAGDNLEMLISGLSVWENYTIEITLDYENYAGETRTEIWNHQVGEWTRENFRNSVDYKFM